MLNMRHACGYRRTRQCAALMCAGVVASGATVAVAGDAPAVLRRPISELTPETVIHLGKTADWVVITPDSVWVGTTGPNAVQQIDPRTNSRVATVPVPGDPCAGLAVGFGSLWIPLCAKPNALVRMDLRTRSLTVLPGIGPAAEEGGITTSPDSVWLVIDERATLARIDPASGRIRQSIQLPAGSHNPLYSDGQIWVSRAAGAEVTVIDATTGAVSASVPTGAKPRFLTAGAGAVWTLNQGDGSLSRIDTRTRQATQLALGTPGHGGDISFGGGMIWTTVAKVPLSVTDAATGKLLCQWSGPGGDSLGIGYGAIWLTDYHGGAIARYELEYTLARCRQTLRR